MKARPITRILPITFASLSSIYWLIAITVGVIRLVNPDTRDNWNQALVFEPGYQLVRHVLDSSWLIQLADTVAQADLIITFVIILFLMIVAGFGGITWMLTHLIVSQIHRCRIRRDKARESI